MAPAGAVLVADRYAVLAFSTREGESSDAWLAPAGSLCTSRWLATLRSGTHTVVIGTVTAVPIVIGNFPSHAPMGLVGVTVQLSGTGAVAGPTVYVELTDAGGHFLVASAQ